MEEDNSMNVQFNMLLNIVNSILKIFNKEKYYLKDPLNPEFYVKKIYYCPVDDELYCYMVDEKIEERTKK